MKEITTKRAGDHGFAFPSKNYFQVGWLADEEHKPGDTFAIHLQRKQALNQWAVVAKLLEQSQVLALFVTHGEFVFLGWWWC